MNSDSKEGNKSLIGAIGLAVFIVILFFKGCGGNGEKTVPVKLPEVKGKLEAVKPEQKPLSVNDKSKNDNFVFGQNLSKKEREFLLAEISKLLAENGKLEQEFMNANDSLMQVIYSKAIELKYFNHKWENDTISANVKGIVRGEIQNIALDYTIKSRTVEVPKPKEVVFRMLGGVEVGNTTRFNDFRVKANVGFQNRSGAILSIGADTEQRFYVGYTVPIFTIKR